MRPAPDRQAAAVEPEDEPDEPDELDVEDVEDEEDVEADAAAGSFFAPSPDGFEESLDGFDEVVDVDDPEERLSVR
ncbi:hypothetical protein GCM10009530_59800 [Microbispora corallina]|uniref:Uncharacterized protein n=1 Tax=Microbispora corallina TaxID=83302 RepID=A0ABQ4GA72_9ACTN|nr:hypothetical protein Mco01_69450 [Microbispora corallina]